MLKHFKNFAADESGAVTVDWVVLTAAIVGLGIAIMATVTTAVGNVAGDIGADMARQMNADAGGTSYGADS